MYAKGSRHLLISILTSFPLLVIIALFILIPSENWNAIFWVSISLLVISLLLSWVAPKLVSLVPRSSFLIGTTYYGIVSFYSFLAMLFIVAFGFIWPTSLRIYLVLHLFLLFGCMVLLGLFTIFNDQVRKNHNEMIQARNLKDSLERLSHKIVHQIKAYEFDEVDTYLKKYDNLADKIRFSDPTSNSYSAPYEEDLLMAMEQLNNKLIDKDELMPIEEFDLSVDNMIYLLEERNSVLCTYK